MMKATKKREQTSELCYRIFKLNQAIDFNFFLACDWVCFTDEQ